MKCFGGLQDERNAWAFYSAEDTTALISYPELPTFRIASFTKWFVESFSAYQGLSKKEIDVKQSSGKGLGKSDGVAEKKFWLSFLEKGTEQVFSRNRMSSDRELHKRYLVRSWNSLPRRRLRLLLGYK